MEKRVYRGKIAYNAYHWDHTRRGADTLTQRQVDVLYFLAEGKQLPYIARVLKITPRTVNFHLYRAMYNLHCSTVIQTVAKAVRMRYI